ncbi:PAS domain-containing hybrid sensor histidine kinase/response regulator [Noviherbaspirillum sp.]|uniref:PAS domain-containing hybrid sensor histidine kinase/response regulator n=1 Tax=Noviherbaspirillum sp. TaxID=1926288 RepID=UPI002FE2C882
MNTQTLSDLPASVLEAAFNALPIGCYFLAPTPEATILGVNDAFLHTINRQRKDLVGKGLFDVFPGDPDDAGDTGEAALRESIARALQTGQPAPMPVQRYPIQKPTANGGVVYEERFWNACNTPLFGEDGRIACVFHTTIEVTMQVRAEQGLGAKERQALEFAHRAEEERRRLDAVLAATPIGLVVTDAKGGLTNTNAAHKKLWGESNPDTHSVDDYREYKGWWAEPLRQGQALEPHDWPAARALTGEHALGDLIEIASFDDPPVHRICSLSAAPIRDEAGRIMGAVLAELDVTERIDAEKALKIADRRKDEFLAMLAHELRNPLAPISAAADLLSCGGLDPERLQHISGIISRQFRHMTGLVNDLLDVSRVTRGLVKLDVQKLDAKQIVAFAVEQVRPLIEARGHHLAVHTPPGSACVQGDSKRLVQALSNVLSNAVKYTPEGGNITLDMEIDRSHVSIRVQDNGIGMDPELLVQAFELFAQAERASDRAQGGLGIGLALVKSLMDLHGGSVHACSDGPGKGSCISLRLPYVCDAATDSPFDTSRRELAVTSAPMRVMVVDDNEDAARMLAMVVTSLGHKVTIEHSPRKALERAERERPQLFLLDIGLPDMDGYELARHLRAASTTSAIFLIAVTGYGQEQDRACALQAGFDHFLVKPVDMVQLADILRDTSTMLSHRNFGPPR